MKWDKPELVSVFNKSVSSEPPIISIVIPIFNQAPVIFNNLMSIMRNTSLLTELIIINDASEDGTESELSRFIKSALPLSKNIISIHKYTFHKPRFETYCDHFGVLNAKGKYIIEIQADMEIVEPRFDLKMINALEGDRRIFMASGRGIMDFETVRSHFVKSAGTEASLTGSLVKSIVVKLFNKKAITTGQKNRYKLNPEDIFPTSEQYKTTKKAGRLGRLIEFEIPTGSNHVYFGETVMRGPIAFERKRYDQLGGLNTKSFFLGFDEHDLNLRARIEHAWMAAFVPIAFNSPLENGSMRKERSRRARAEIFLAQKRIKRFKSDSTLSKASTLGKIEFQDHEKK